MLHDWGLSLLLILPLIYALILTVLPDNNRLLHGFSAVGSGALFLLSVFLWVTNGPQHEEFMPWLPTFGINYHVGADSLSWVLVLLTTLLIFLSVLASFSSIEKRLKLYYSMMFVLTTAILGVFLSRDLFVFFLSWELELIPMYLLIAIWGGPRREYAALKFVLYTLFGSVFMFAAVLGTFFLSHIPSFDFTILSQVAAVDNLTLGAQIALFIGFFMAFCIKLPMVPFHTWLPDAHVEAPTPISMLLAGILLKMGAYGMLRFCFGWFPEAAHALAPYLVFIGFINIVYTAGVAMVQADLKKLIAYSSVSHMGFVLLGLGALNSTGFNGAVFQMISHGLISAGLFMIVGTLYVRTHTRQISEMGGFAKQLPTIYFFGLVITLASLGLPLLAGFPAETLVLYGAYLSSAFHAIPWFGHMIPLSIQVLTILSAIGVVLGAAYLLLMLQRVFTGPLADKWATLRDATPSEIFVLSVLTFLIVGVGIFPNLVSHQFDALMTSMAQPYAAMQEAHNITPALHSTTALSAKLPIRLMAGTPNNKN